MDSISLAALVAARIAAKRDEDAAVARRREIDQQLAARLAQADKAEGSVTERLDGYKLTVTYNVTRKVDADALQRDWAQLPHGLTGAFRWKPEVSTTELRKLSADLAAIAAAYYTTAPASPSIKIEAV